MTLLSPRESRRVSQSSALLNAFESVESFACARGLELPEMPLETENRVLALETETQFAIARSIRNWLSSYERCSTLNIDVSTDARALREFLNLMSYHVDESFFSTLRDGDCIEAYEFTTDLCGSIQCWRNWRFLELASYDLATLTLYPMHELFRRDSFVQDYIDRLVLGLIGEPKTTISGIPPHTLTEIKNKHNRQFHIHNRFVSPIFDASKRVVGFMSTLYAKPLGSAYAGLNVRPLSL